jgi:opacity protein-like surface antigen
MLKRIGLAVMAMAMMSFTTAPARAAEEGWQFKVTPYLWAMGVKGDLGLGAVSAPVDVDFLDAVQDLDIGGMLSAEADYGPWSVLGDVAYLRLSDKTDTALGEFKAELEQWMIEGAVVYGVVQAEKTRLDLGLGGRFMDLDTTLKTPSIAADKTQSESWTDPILVARVRQQFTEKFYGVLLGDIGGFGVASDLTWQMMAAGGYAFTDSFSMLLGYRYLDYDYENGKFSFDAATSGLVLGLQFNL